MRRLLLATTAVAVLLAPTVAPAQTITPLSVLDSNGVTRQVCAVTLSSNYYTCPMLFGSNAGTPQSVNTDGNHNLDVFVAGGVTGVASVITAPQATPTNSTSAYVSGYVIGGVMSFTTTNSGTINAVNLVFASGANLAETDIFWFNANPTSSTTTDHGQFTMAAADYGKYIGFSQVMNCVYINSGSTATACKAQNEGLTFQLSGVTTTLYGVAVTRGAPTFTTTTAMTVEPAISQ